jgi:hypothetical protein
MTRTEWEKINNYTNERNCNFCKYCRDASIHYYKKDLICSKKEEAGIGKSVRTNCCCDLWEHKIGAWEAK